MKKAKSGRLLKILKLLRINRTFAVITFFAALGLMVPVSITGYTVFTGSAEFVGYKAMACVACMAFSAYIFFRK